MVLVVDNYDSFTYNLVHLLGTDRAVRVVRNDALSVSEIADLKPAGILISPGPGRPENAGVTLDLVRELGASTPMLGVCLGHQAIAMAYGASVVHASRLMHGKTSRIEHDAKGVFRGLLPGFSATRYHSLAVQENTLPDTLQVTARAEDGEIMGLTHTRHPVTGIQFHPESILTESGPAILANWLETLA